MDTNGRTLIRHSGYSRRTWIKDLPRARCRACPSDRVLIATLIILILSGAMGGVMLYYGF
jgi:hypothetical protein